MGVTKSSTELLTASVHEPNKLLTASVHEPNDWVGETSLIWEEQ
jgi:hypothetical protein